MAAKAPDWVDQKLSAELPILRGKGESQELEYMAAFPENARELGKEIAAFASSNPGVILLGVSDDGDLLGLPGFEGDSGVRDALVRRIEGVCSGTVRPAVTPGFAFAIEHGKVVAIIRVPRGRQPVYYCQNTPYVRHLTQSRPADPQEVIDLVRGWLVSVNEPRGDDISPRERAISSFLSRLAVVLRDLLVYGSEAAERSVNPYLDELMATFGNAADELREFSAAEEAELLSVRQDLIRLAEACDAVAHHVHVLGAGAWKEYLELVSNAVEIATDLKARKIDTQPLAPELIRQATTRLTELGRLVRDLADRAESMAFGGRLQELQERASSLGRAVAELSYLGLDRLPHGLTARLRDIGTRLHLAETVHLSMGEHSIRQLITLVEGIANELDSVIAEIGDPA